MYTPPYLNPQSNNMKYIYHPISIIDRVGLFAYINYVPVTHTTSGVKR